MSIRVLIIDDDEEDFLILQHYLSNVNKTKCVVDWCDDFDQAEKEILKNQHDVYLVDYFLGKGEGIDIIENVRKQHFIKPIILLTGAGDRLEDDKILGKGASDFLDKHELNTAVIERALRYALDRYQQQLHIKNQERKYRRLFELSIEPFAILDDQLNMLEYNAALVTILNDNNNFTPVLIGKPFSYLFEAQDAYQELIKNLKNNGFVKGFKTALRNKEKAIICTISIAELPDKEDIGISGFYVGISDLTKILEQEAELKKLDKLMMSGRMARMIGHEVRNPLTNIRLAVEELTEITIDNEEAKTLHRMIDRNAHRIAKLIEDLLKSARPMELEKTRGNLIDIIDDALEFCQDRIELLGIELVKNIPNQKFIGTWDKEKLKIAIVNIIINSIEAMENRKQPKLTVTLELIDDSYLIHIQDNGKGMDKETKSNLFDPLFTNRMGGIGLGMTTTLNIISMHAGRIHVYSKENEGTEFEIFLKGI